jgi:hypothetical protein
MTREKMQAVLDAGGAYSKRIELRTAVPSTPAENSRIGCAAQHLVAMDILLRGYRCSISAESLPYDLIADIGMLRRVQVKARSFARYRGQRSKAAAYEFCDLSQYRKSADLLALVSMPERCIIYQRADALTSGFISIPVHEMTADRSDASWIAATRYWPK